jgi:signal transduction histidine kinase
VSNAIKFTDKGRIEIKLAKRDESAEVSVADTGIGIKKQDIGKLFQAFGRVTTENRLTEGSGLGLYLSKKIADLLGGEIKAESEFGRGSIFTFTLPLKYKEPDREQAQR